MSHSRLLRFSFGYDTECHTPLVPLRFIDNEGRPTPTFNAILDSGADEITIPKELSDELQLELTSREEPINTAGGEREAFLAVANFNLGRGGREVRYTDIDICVIDENMPILVGITPIFEDYRVIIMAYQNRFILEPRE